MDPDGNATVLDFVKHVINEASSAVGMNQIQWPVSEGRITSAFGARTDAISPHWGIDIAPRIPGSQGVRVNAPAGGDVVFVGHSQGGSSEIQIRLPSGLIVDMKHLSGIPLKPGDTVLRGEKIGVMGSDGPSTGTHVHFEVRPAGATSQIQAKDPIPMLPARPSSIRLTNAVQQRGNTLVNTP